MERNLRTCSFCFNLSCKAKPVRCCSYLHPSLQPYNVRNWPQEATYSLPQQFILSICKEWNTQTTSVLAYIQGLINYFPQYQWDMGAYLHLRDGKEPVNGCPSSHNQTRARQKVILWICSPSPHCYSLENTHDQVGVSVVSYSCCTLQT